MVGIQGVEGSYSHKAVQLLLGETAKWLPTIDFYECFNSLQTELVDAILVPFENKITGIIPEVAALLLKNNLIFTREILLPLDHMLLSKVPTRIEKICRIFSHPQAIAQCRNYLNKLDNVEIISVYDTAGAVEYLGNSDSFAIIAGSNAKKLYKLHLVEKNIQDRNDNSTRFIFIGKQFSQPIHCRKLTLLTVNEEIDNVSALFSQSDISSFRSDKFTSELGRINFYEFTFTLPQLQKNIGNSLTRQGLDYSVVRGIIS